MAVTRKSTEKCYRDVMITVGKRLRAARLSRGLAQGDVAKVTKNTRELISLVETGKSGLSPAKLFAAAQFLKVSMDYLFGLTDDPTPSEELTLDLKTSAALIRDLKQMREEGEVLPDPEYVRVSEVTTAAAAGVGATVGTERVTGRMKFPRPWLNSHGLTASECRIIRVIGESMEPTLPDGSAILVNLASRRRRDNRIFVIRIDEELIVKRAAKDPAAGWQLLSDSPNKTVWPTRPWPADAKVIGEVKWAGRTFV